MMDGNTLSFFQAFQRALQQVDLTKTALQCVEIGEADKVHRFYFIHRDQQSSEQIRAYRQQIFAKMGLDDRVVPIISIIGDSKAFDPAKLEFARKYLFDLFDGHPAHFILFGITSDSNGTNALVSEWGARDPKNQMRIIGNAVNVDTLRAIKIWHCVAGDVHNVVVLFPDGRFGNDNKLSDEFVPQFAKAPGASLVACMEGGIQSFVQCVEMAELDLPIFLVEKIRVPTKFNENLQPFFSAAEFLNHIKERLEGIYKQGREVVPTDCCKIRDDYIYNLKEPYDYEKHKHLHLLAKPTEFEEYSAKLALFNQAFDKFIEKGLWTKEKLKLFVKVSCTEKLEKQEISNAVAAILAMAERNATPIYRRRVSGIECPDFKLEAPLNATANSPD